jgi:hypothetical protein
MDRLTLDCFASTSGHSSYKGLRSYKGLLWGTHRRSLHGMDRLVCTPLVRRAPGSGGPRAARSALHRRACP